MLFRSLPHFKYLTSSYADELSVRDNVKSRDLILTPWYQGYLRHMELEGHGEVWRLKGDQNVKSRYENNRGGHRIATSVGGSATGDGGDAVMVDDPLSAKGGLSKAKLEEAVTWWDRTMSSRLNDQRTGVKIVVMQRLAQGDLSGHILEEIGGYEHLMLPMEYRTVIKVGHFEGSPKDYPTSLGYVDPRTEDGELLFPGRFTPDVVKQLKKDLGSRGYAGQYQQTPVAEGGNTFEKAWFGVVDAVPARAFRVRYWDKAGTEGAGARTVGVLMLKTLEGEYIVEDVVKGQWGATKRNALIKAICEQDAAKYGRLGVQTWNEQEPGSGGKESAENTIKQLAGYDVHSERVTGSKEERAVPFAVQAEAGNVKLLRAPWNKDYLEELEMFPAGKFKDQVDASSGAFNKLALGRSALERMRALNGD